MRRRLINEGEGDKKKVSPEPLVITYRKKGKKSPEERFAIFIRVSICIILFCSLAQLGITITEVVFGIKVYNNVKTEITPSNLQATIQEIIPKEYIEQIIIETIQGFLASGYEKSFEQNCLPISTVKEKCRVVDYCSKSRNITGCAHYFTNTVNWCQAYL
jgi:hypothetical protein